MGASSASGFILFDLAGLAPETGAPPPERIITGSPGNKSWNLYASADQKLHAGIWESEPGAWHIVYDEDEFCHILAGESRITHESGASFTVKTGDAFVIPKGFIGTWEVVTRTRKHYVIYLT